MITLKTPIELICNTAMIPSYEAFYHRIIGNYEIMASGITGEDLLHVVTAPPEVYLAEGGITNLENNTRINNRQETKLEIINNLLNRIVLNEDVNLTYQDRVYITEVLNKLGIRNVWQFMKQVNRLKQETADIQQLISVYWSYMEELTGRVQEYQNLYLEEQQVTEDVFKTERIHLHEDILKRLQTGAIYQILSNFYAGYNGSSWYVNAPEFQITEQKRVASNILLNQLENVIQGENVPLVFRHENYYETMDFTEIQRDEDYINHQVTSAVLLNLIDNLYFNRFEKQQHNFESWLQIKDALYQTAGNTIWRLQTGLTSIRNVQSSQEETSIYQQRYKQELSLVYQMLRGTEPDEEELYSELPLPEISWREPAVQPERQDITYVTEAEEEKAPLTIQKSETELLQEQLRQINQQNIENYNRFQQLLKQQQEHQEPVGRDNRERMRRESLMALTDPAGLLEEYREEADKREQKTADRILEITKLLPEQTREVYERLIQYQTNPEVFGPEARISHNNINLLLRDIQNVEQNQEMEVQRLIESRQAEAERVITDSGEKEEERVSRQPEQLWENAETPIPKEVQGHEAMELLLHDIRTVEQNREMERLQILESQQSELIREVSENVIERWRDQGTQRETEERSRIETAGRDISLVHRSTENRVDEEMLEEIIEQNRLLTQKTQVTEREERISQVVNRTVSQQTINQQTITQETENINELIRQGVRQQMNALSEQVYNKLEKRLQNERRRRGY